MAQIGVKKGNIRKISVSISEISADWIESQVESMKYRNVSHAIDALIRDAMKSNGSNTTP
jgi:Arc/MetJ-type ribon-helix-helix transcriptional regulator